MIYWHFKNNVRPCVWSDGGWNIRHGWWCPVCCVAALPPSPIATNCHRLLPECLFTWVHHHIVLYTTCIQLTLPHQLEWRSRTVSQWYSDNDVIVSNWDRWARNVFLRKSLYLDHRGQSKLNFIASHFPRKVNLKSDSSVM